MAETIPVNPEVLKWARESAGLTVNEVVTKMKRKRISHDTIDAWELGVDAPTYPQLERLAYEIYKRPLAMFFFPEPPEEVTAKQSFRTLPEFEIDSMSAKMRFLLRKAQAYQHNVYELYDGVNPAEKQITKELSFELSTSVSDMGKQVREYLSITLEEQSSFGNSEKAFKEWRKILEDLGVFVFKDAFKEDEFSGFCLYDDKFPIIYVNNSKSFNRQIFTLFHELAHLLFKTGGVDTHIDDYIDYLQGEDKQIEIICNSFAGEFLVPSDHFYNVADALPVDEESLSLLANNYNVSREVILRKFLDQGRIDSDFYYNKVNSWKKVPIASKSDGGNYYFTKGAYLGSKYIEKVFSQYYQDRITTERLADYLDIKVKSIPGVESLLYKSETST
jgi:Zn-dependent peptidase ImmA (M78 family)